MGIAVCCAGARGLTRARVRGAGRVRDEHTFDGGTWRSGCSPPRGASPTLHSMQHTQYRRSARRHGSWTRAKCQGTALVVSPCVSRRPATAKVRWRHALSRGNAAFPSSSPDGGWRGGTIAVRRGAVASAVFAPVVGFGGRFLGTRVHGRAERPAGVVGVF